MDDRGVDGTILGPFQRVSHDTGGRDLTQKLEDSNLIQEGTKGQPPTLLVMKGC